MIVTGKFIEKGRFSERGSLAAMLIAAAIKWPGQMVTISINIARSVRSIKQNAYYWGVVVHMLAEASGHTPEEMNELLKGQFLRTWISVLHYDKETKVHDYVEDERVLSTKDLKTDEMEAFLEKCRCLGDEFYEIYIPKPKEPLAEELMKMNRFIN